jgi:hypothetical protein
MADAYSVDLSTGILSYNDANPPFTMTSKLFNDDLNLLCNGYGHYYIDSGMAKVDDDPFAQADRELTARGSITSLGGDRTVLSSTDIIRVQTYIDIGKVVPIGATPSASMQLILSNVNRQWDSFHLDGSEVEIELGAKNESDAYEYFSLGIFVVEKVDNQYGNPVITIQASDYMSNKMMTEWVDPGIYPRTYADIITDACNQAGVLLYSATFYGYLSTISAQPTFPDQTITCKDIIGWIACLSAQNAIIDADGKLRISSVFSSFGGYKTISNARYKKPTLDNFPICTAYIVKLYAPDAPSGTAPYEYAYSLGGYDSRAYELKITDNPFVLYADGALNDTIAAIIGENLGAWIISRGSGRVSWFGAPNYDVCDTIIIQKQNGDEVYIGILQQRIDYSAESGLSFESGCDMTGLTLSNSILTEWGWV